MMQGSTMKSKKNFAIQRLMNAMRQAHADGWFIVFDTLTLADDRLEAFYDNPNALRDYFRDIGRMVLAAAGRNANDSHADCYQYFCVREYGTDNGRLHFCFQAEDGIRDYKVTGVQTCALPISINRDDLEGIEIPLLRQARTRNFNSLQVVTVDGAKGGTLALGGKARLMVPEEIEQE